MIEQSYRTVVWLYISLNSRNYALEQRHEINIGVIKTPTYSLIPNNVLNQFGPIVSFEIFMIRLILHLQIIYLVVQENFSKLVGMSISLVYSRAPRFQHNYYITGH